MPTVMQTKMKSKVTKKKVEGDAWDNLTKLTAEPEGNLKILIYGRSGTGKTTFWGSFPGPILVLVCSGGMKSGECLSLKDKKLLAKKDIFPHYVKSSIEIDEFVAKQAETGRFRTVVIDHVTGLQDKVLAEILDIDELPVQKAWGTATQQDYQQCTAQCKEHFKRMLNLDCNVVFIGQERDFNNDEDSRNGGIQPYVAAALTPSLVGWLNPACDYIVQTLIRPKMVERRMKIGKKVSTKIVKVEGEVEYVAHIAPHDVVTTKFRVPKGHKMPKYIIDPDYDKVLALLSGSAE